MFRLLTFRDNQRRNRPGILVDKSVYDIGDEFDSVLSILESWDKIEQQLMEMGQQLAQNPNSSGASVHEVSLAPPILYPGALYCAGANYADHVLEMSGKPPPAENTKPYFFIKSTRGTIIGANDAIHLPEYSNQVDWEAEIGVVIGREARNVNEVDAMDLKLYGTMGCHYCHEYTLPKWRINARLPIGSSINTVDLLMDPLREVPKRMLGETRYPLLTVTRKKIKTLCCRGYN